MHQAPAEVSLSLQLHPDGAKEKLKDGSLPIHYAARNEALTEVSLELLRCMFLQSKPRARGDRPTVKLHLCGGARRQNCSRTSA